MLDVITTSFHIKSELLDKNVFEHLALELYDEWEQNVSEILKLEDYSLSLVVEEGSIKGKGKIMASATALYLAISSYGDFIDGLTAINSQAKTINSILFQLAKSKFKCKTAQGNTKRSGGEIHYLDRLLKRVERHELSSDKAMEEVRARWGVEAASAPDFMNSLAISLENVPCISMPPSYSVKIRSSSDSLNAPVPRPAPRAPRPLEVAMRQHFRVEISRPSKGVKKKIQTT